MAKRGALVLALALAGCEDAYYPRPVVEYGANWMGVQAFSHEFCSDCHPSIAEPAFPDALEADLTCYNDACEVTPTECTGLTCDDCRALLCSTYIVPHDPEGSLFWRVISDDDRQPGERAEPPTGTLSAEQIEFVREWIDAGAPL